jgi:hypothetical protein
MHLTFHIVNIFDTSSGLISIAFISLSLLCKFYFIFVSAYFGVRFCSKHLLLKNILALQFNSLSFMFMKGSNHVERDLGVVGGIILKCILKKSSSRTTALWREGLRTPMAHRAMLAGA